ncbi:thiamine pyrophosphate-binding protein [Oceanomicrobium pacificus]|uniref:Thiamine pyrophosphate-binding protein n=1 Tax=Oceanomicrobium pacificus TaxID=2692916 RepID=A0A6B0TPT1_9RHOB|nr:thiamine pyrophosphate-binding protein [Oceanomicrobium pacificus]MXU66680.1 thiamine pyrophosphate-binding protein [Oceanomicrobium pacificus]
MRHGGQILADQLKIQGVDRVFCVPGESYLAALDGLHESGIEVVTGRNEGGVAMMAEADGKLTGRPGIAFVTRGPGATNASAGVHVAFQDSTPMILFIGQVASDQRDREAFQEVDYRAMFGPLAKWVESIDRLDRLPEYLSRAFHIAQSGRPGPVVLALPEDMLSGQAEVADAKAGRAAIHPAGIEDARRVIALLEEAERPFVIVGGGGWSAGARDDLATFASRFDLPVGTSFRCQDYLDNRHDCYAGDVGIGINPALAARVRDADLLLVLGARLGEITTSGYSLIDSPDPKQRLVHVHADPEELGRVFNPELGIATRAADLLAALAALPAPAQTRWSSARAAARADYLAWQEPDPTPGNLQLEHVITHLNDVLGDDAILTNGAGNYATWLHRYYRFRGWRTQLAPTSGSMGYGLPASVAAKLRHPERDVICYAGDGCFQMSMQEFGTACQYGANIIVLISNNGMYGTIRMHQERSYPGRVSGTRLTNPDYRALAESYGGHGECVTANAEFAPALARARKSGKPAIIELRIDPSALGTRLVLDRP